MTPRLSTETLCEARAHVRRPAYDRSRLSTGIVHLGLGAFARAHLCAYTEDCIERGGAEHWGIAGVNLRSTEQRDRLLPQDRLYTLVPRGEKGLAPRVIGCLTEVLAGPGATADILAHLAAPATRIVGLTVTEKGYCHDPATGRLDRTHPDIVHDLVHLDAPRSAIGVVVAALAVRR